jgi:hypothetical protein
MHTMIRGRCKRPVYEGRVCSLMVYVFEVIQLISLGVKPASRISSRGSKGSPLSIRACSTISRQSSRLHALLPASFWPSDAYLSKAHPTTGHSMLAKCPSLTGRPCINPRACKRPGPAHPRAILLLESWKASPGVATPKLQMIH